MALGCVQDTQYSCADAVPCPSKPTPSHEPATTSGLPSLAVMCALLLTSARKAPKMRHFLDEIASLRQTGPPRPPKGALIVKPPLRQSPVWHPSARPHLALAGGGCPALPQTAIGASASSGSRAPRPACGRAWTPPVVSSAPAGYFCRDNCAGSGASPTDNGRTNVSG